MKVAKKLGFTIIEVALFLAISGAVFAMIMQNTSSTVAKRRYSDSVNDLAENIRNAYSATINVQIDRTLNNESSTFCSLSTAINSHFSDDSTVDNYPGRTRCAVYGQLLVFGENNNATEMNRYDIIGKAVTNNILNINPDGDDDVIEALKDVGADVVTVKRVSNGSATCSARLAGTTTKYTTLWGATIEDGTINRGVYRGAIMIARSPISGTIHTYFYTDTGNLNLLNSTTINVSDFAKKSNKACTGFNSDDNYLGKMIKLGRMKQKASSDGITICVGSDDLFAVAGRRRAIKIHGDGSTESAVEVLPADSSESIKACQ